MPQLQAYHRPETVAEALELLTREGVSTAVLAGGTRLVPRLESTVEEVVDLQAAGLDQIEEDEGRLTLGAMVRLQAVVDAEAVPALLRDLARRAGPNTFRNQETVGGTIVTADPESEFLAGLLAHEAAVTVQSRSGSQTLPLSEFLQDVEAGLQGGLLTGVTVTTGGETAHARVARTPADTPIVAAVARREGGELSLALCGVAATPVPVAPDEVDNLDPPADFRGSSEYRKAMARLLTQRVIQELGLGA
jgi:probable selenate reductase FAD-binding subunit